MLGLDPGLSATGFGLLEDSIYITHGVVRTNGSSPLGHRLKEVTDKLRRLLRKERPDLCAIESLFFKKDAARSVILSAHLRGALFLLLEKERIPVVELTPATVKLAVTGSGRASKKQVSFMVTSLLGLDDEVPEDACDALAIAFCAGRKFKKDDRPAARPNYREESDQPHD